MALRAVLGLPGSRPGTQREGPGEARRRPSTGHARGFCHGWSEPMVAHPAAAEGDDESL